MARTVVNTTRSANRYDILSQTPKNYDKDNYFIKELQDKVDAEWEYRPNRVDVEYEDSWGDQTYSSIEVVMQSVKSENGTEIADDYRKLVFRNILENRFKIGNRFRFGAFRGFGTDQIQDKDKNIWITTNNNTMKMTSSVVIRRCNGTLGSTYKDSQGVSHYHYEPVIQERDLSGVNFIYNDMAVSPQAQLQITAQHNEYTKEYFINQRFIIGYDRVYKVKSINKFYSNSTFDSENVGIIQIYLELTENSPYDDFDNRIAYQSTDIVTPESEGDKKDEYTIKFTTPDTIPSRLGSQPVEFTPVVLKSGVIDTTKSVKCEYSLSGLSTGVSIDNYLSMTQDSGVFTFTRKRVYLGGVLTITWIILDSDGVTPIGSSMSFNMDLR